MNGGYKVHGDAIPEHLSGLHSGDAGLSKPTFDARRTPPGRSDRSLLIVLARERFIVEARVVIA